MKKPGERRAFLRGRAYASGGLHFGRHDIGELVLLGSLGAELHVAVDQREQREILAEPDAHARMNHRAALPHDDAAGADRLAAVHLGAEALGVRIAAVARAAASFFVCHGSVPIFLVYPTIASILSSV